MIDNHHPEKGHGHAPDERLPYDFDLLWDVKTMADVEAIAAGEPHRSDASPKDLLEMFMNCHLAIPECLINRSDIDNIRSRINTGQAKYSTAIGDLIQYSYRISRERNELKRKCEAYDAGMKDLTHGNYERSTAHIRGSEWNDLLDKIESTRQRIKEMK